MKLTEAVFILADKLHGEVTVRFLYEAGEPTEAIVSVDGSEFRIDNSKGEYKACATHSGYLIRQATFKPPENEFARKKFKSMQPKVRIARSAP